MYKKERLFNRVETSKGSPKKRERVSKMFLEESMLCGIVALCYYYRK